MIDHTTPGFEKPISADEQFFYDHAGWGYHPDHETPEEGRWRGARKLAAAEKEGKRRGWYVDWEVEPDPMEDDVERDEEYDQFMATLLDEDGDVIGHLGSIDLGPGQCMGYDARPHGFEGRHPGPVAKTYDPYVRVVEAELMLEALAEIA